MYDKYQAEIQSIIVSDFEYVEEENIPYTIETKSKSSYVTEIIAKGKAIEDAICEQEIEILKVVNDKIGL